MYAVAPVVTALYAGLLGLLLVALAFAVSKQRLRHKVSTGDGGVPQLAGAIRAHGNFAEYVPLALVLIALTETTGSAPWQVHLLGAGLFIGRVLHAQGISRRPQGRTFGRTWGIVLTWVVILVASILLLLRSIMTVG